MASQVLRYSAAVVLSVLYFRISQIMVSLISTGTQTGYFGVSFRILDSLTIIPPLLVSSALPVLARAARDDAQRFAYVSLRLVEAIIDVGVGVAIAIFLGAGFIVHPWLDTALVRRSRPCGYRPLPWWVRSSLLVAAMPSCRSAVCGRC